MTDAFTRLAAGIVSYVDMLQFAGKGDVMAGIAQAIAQPPQAIAPRRSEMCDKHLPQCLAQLRADGHATLANAIATAVPLLAWVTYDAYPAEIGDFATAHAFASLIGDGAPFAADDFDLGLFLIAPDILYRDHHHAAPELYAPLTGPHGWRFAVDAPFVAKPAHVPVWNEPWQVHATLTGETPLLCIFCWTRDVRQPARIVFS